MAQITVNTQSTGRETKSKYLSYRRTFETSPFLWLRAKNVSLVHQRSERSSSI